MNTTKRALADVLIFAAVLLAIACCAIAGSGGVSPRPASWSADGAAQFPAVAFTGVAGDAPGAIAGMAWHDTTRKALRGQTAAGVGGVGLLFAPAIADSGTLANPTSATAFSVKVTLPAACLTAGKVIRTTSWGRYTTGVALTPTLDVGTRIGGAAFAASGLISVSASLTNQAWYAESSALVRTIGAGGTASGFHRTELGGVLALTTPTSQVGRSGSVALDTTATCDVEQSAKFGATDASNAITMEGLLVEVLN